MDEMVCAHTFFKRKGAKLDFASDCVSKFDSRGSVGRNSRGESFAWSVLSQPER